MKQLLALAKGGDRGLWVVLLGGVIVQTVFLYQGSPAFFRDVLGGPGAEQPNGDWYAYLYMHAACLLLLGVVPFVTARLLLGEGPRELGLTAGDWRFGLKLLAVGIVVIPLLASTGLGDAEMVAEYPLTDRACQGGSTFLLWELTYLLYYIGWEAHFRGFMLFSLAKRVGNTAAVLIQMIPSTLIHIAYPKPISETFVAIFVGGIVFGFLALRCRSFLYVLALHWVAGMSFDALSCWLG
jgi:membrane protease YdiL (CAAX protease family)